MNGKPGNAPESKKWVISENSSLCVNGSTNINKFACDIPAYDQTDTLTLKVKTDKEIILSGNVGLKVQSFDCHNSMMTKDLRKTLKEPRYPLLHIGFLSLSKLPSLDARPEPITGMVDIEIAGIHKRFEVNYQISQDAQKVIHLLGSRDVNFSDFNLIPPRKLGGMIKTNDKLTVTFHLKMTALN
ncbi:MAG: YceI family protein [Mucilaginibacter sp.]